MRGEFTRSGFAFMQDAIQHPTRYFQGETWVLGDQAAHSLDTASVSKQLAAMYSGDFIKQWHSFLTDARVVGCGSIHEAPDKLNALAGPESPIPVSYTHLEVPKTPIGDVGEVVLSTFAAHDLLLEIETDEKLLAIRPKLAGHVRLEQVCDLSLIHI